MRPGKTPAERNPGRLGSGPERGRRLRAGRGEEEADLRWVPAPRLEGGGGRAGGGAAAEAGCAWAQRQGAGAGGGA